MILFPVLFWGHADFFFEFLGEVAMVIKTHIQCNLSDCRIGLAQGLTGCVDTHFINIFDGAQMKEFPEATVELAYGQMDFLLAYGKIEFRILSMHQ